jgi:tetratricopeptide (TPR) repeat protein
MHAGFFERNFEKPSMQSADGTLLCEARQLLAAGQERAERGDHAGAIHLFEQCRRRGDHIVNARTKAKVSGAAAGATGTAYAALGEFDTAIAHFNVALEICRNQGDRRCEAMRLSNLGSVYTRKREFDRAAEHYEQALGAAVDQAAVDQIRANMQLVEPSKVRKLSKAKGKPLSTSTARRNLCTV